MKRVNKNIRKKRLRFFFGNRQFLQFSLLEKLKIPNLNNMNKEQLFFEFYRLRLNKIKK